MAEKYFAVIRACNASEEKEAGKVITDTWEERFEVSSPGTAAQDAHDIICNFNENLHPGEKPRRLLNIIRVETQREHDWEKKNLVTIFNKKGSYDLYRCQSCGAEVKRFSLEGYELKGICPGPKSSRKKYKSEITTGTLINQAPQLNYIEEKEAEKTAKVKQKDLDGGEAEAPGPNGTIPEGEGVLLSLEVVDVTFHEKRGGFFNVPLFANIGPKGKNRLGTANIALNNLSKEGLAYITRALGKKPTMKTPVMAKIFIPVGSLLDHWTEMRPSKEDQAAEKDKEAGKE